ncbi:hypothetical protein Bca4012_004509 [Brassica carinata]
MPLSSFKNPKPVVVHRRGVAAEVLGDRECKKGRLGYGFSWWRVSAFINHHHPRFLLVAIKSDFKSWI